jgi:hypothetical protein
VIPLAVKLVILFYAVEVLLHQMKGRWTIVPLAALWAFTVLMLKGLKFL